MTIKDNQYNKARSILARAGSDSAKKSHPKHNTKGGSPDRHGQNLINEAIEDFRLMDAGQANLINGMTAEHAEAIRKAENEMGL
ncbi:hypothetical protein [Gilvimarinus chinensis]|uniref:hypothetical protein n=1 Tax=Gilvimarinus chinensis TaxID=396005 RepID=UPI000375C1D6|nr:hypothetical protein [Gilvimarinus chinensis]